MDKAFLRGVFMRMLEDLAFPDAAHDMAQLIGDYRSRTGREIPQDEVVHVMRRAFIPKHVMRQAERFPLIHARLQ